MGRLYAFVDEFGSHGFKFEADGCTTHFIVSAIIVEEKDLYKVYQGVKRVSEKYFPNGEIKSSSIGKNHRRRVKILKELTPLPFKIFALVCDKRKIYENCGLRYEKSFYKFINNLLYKELRTSFSKLVIVADELKGNRFMREFARYVKRNEVHLDLFDESEFRFENSKDNVIIQIADVISGSLAYNYDEKHKAQASTYNYKAILNSKIIGLKLFPATFEDFKPKQEIPSSQYNPDIAEVCYRRAVAFLNKKENAQDIEEKQQLAVIKYLLFRFMNRSSRKYIPTREIINQLVFLGYEKLSIQTFRTRIIAKLRDNDVIISSSSKGYKIPSTETEVYDFINHGKSIILPMLARLKKCNDIIKAGTRGEIDLFQRAEYQILSNMIGENKD